MTSAPSEKWESREKRVVWGEPVIWVEFFLILTQSIDYFLSFRQNLFVFIYNENISIPYGPTSFTF